MGIIKNPGRQATKMEQILLVPTVMEKLGNKDRVVIHHITEDTAYKLQLEVEAYLGNAVSFHRLILN